MSSREGYVTQYWGKTCDNITLDEIKQLLVELGSNTPLNDSDISTIPTVQEDTPIINILRIENSKIDLVKCEYLGKILENNTTLISLELSGINIANEGIKYICDGLRNNVSIRELFLRNININNDSIRYICDALRDNTSLKVLDINNINIDSDGIKYICDTLKNNTFLEELHISNIIIDSKGMKYIGNILKPVKQTDHNISSNDTNCGLKKLWFYNNKINDEGMKYLCYGLCDNKSLNEIGVEINGITDLSAQYICEVLKYNTSLTMINLSGNFMSDIGGQLISDQLKQNTTLKNLCIRNNNIPADHEVHDWGTNAGFEKRKKLNVGKYTKLAKE